MFEYHALLVLAYNHLRLGRDEEGLRALGRSLSICRKYGYIHYPILLTPDRVSFLCARALEAGIEVDHVCDMIDELGLQPVESTMSCEQWPWPLRVYTLGRFEVVRQGEALDVTSRSHRKPLEMLKAAIALGPRGCRQERICDALWPDADGDRAQRSFTTNLHRLRALLGRHCVRFQESRVWLDPTTCWIDVSAFERRLERADACIEEGREPEAIRQYEAAIALYDGEFLVGETGPECCASVRGRLSERYIGALGRAAGHLVDSGEHEKALGLYVEALESDALAEAFYRGALQCCLALDRFEEGTRIYDRCEQALRRHLGVEPSGRTRNLYRSIRERAGSRS